MYAIVAAGPSWDETSGYGAGGLDRAETAAYEATAESNDEAALLAQFRAVKLSLSRYLGAEQPEASSCDGGD